MVAIVERTDTAPVECCNMRIFLAGVGCVGKTTVGAKLAGLLHYRFFDLDAEIERLFGTPIERLRNSYLTSHSFRIAASQALTHVLSREDSRNCVIALPPSGLMGGYWSVVNKTQDATIVVLKDTPENILRRIAFYDIDSRPIQRDLTDREKRLHLRQIKADITYFGRSFQRAHMSVDIAGCSPDEASRKVRDALAPAPLSEQGQAPEHALGGTQ
jgi:shikimate kinase